MRKFILALPILALTACGGGGTNNEMINDDVDIIVDAPTFTVYGDSTVTADGAIEPQEFLAQMAGKDSLKIKVRATIKEAAPDVI